MNKQLRLTDDWGILVVNHRGIIQDMNADFCQSFLINKEAYIGLALNVVIQGTTHRKKRNIIFGMVLGDACLIRVSEESDNTYYRIIIRGKDIEQIDVRAFLGSFNSKSKTNGNTYQHRYCFDDILGESPAMESIKELAARIATSNSTVLLTGESGTGKELFAQAIHGLSTRKQHPFVAVNCAAIPDELFESEVFGYEAGAFSGARKEGKPGKIELAQGGTLFLDEISELPFQAQGKLLRVLQEREVERVGGTSNRIVDIRIIAATNRDLRMLVQEGKFRQDLFYRLYVFDLQIPSLRERKEDIIPLAHAFINDFNNQFGMRVTGMDDRLREWMIHYDWPGNVRELKAYIERAMYIANGEILSLSDSIKTTSISNHQETKEAPLFSLEEEVSRAEKAAIQRALQEANGDRTKAAYALKIHIASLYRKIAKYQLN
ncbi:sigma-54 interaction domain-containing protein [Bacillus massiliigorillae]|uniref:sigma-54 interaction domain-containing protein n=1 Tax=Bacillus massiliigorillae TaxID=1243664 RepID=UPI0003A667A4|nr:sigma 54-interacting transcriptional regulator [Bacillus massiliigorillae]